MEKVYINGRFLSQKITGVQRVGREILKELQNSSDYEFIVLVPKGTVKEELYSKLSFIEVGKRNGYYWEQIELPKYLKKIGKPKLINFCNISPMTYKNSYVILHDTTFKDKCKYVDKKWAFRYKLIVRSYIYKVKKVFTVSNFTAGEIKKYYPKMKNNPIVLYNGHEQLDNIEPVVVNDIPENFLLSVGSVNMNKNFQYILYLAKNNPDLNFVITGNQNHFYNEFVQEYKINNCHFTGYLSDGELKYLYSKCSGFILPSFYEGFGLPPLEALSQGCKKLYLSDIPPFKEIYGNIAKFFNPYDYENTVKLDDFTIDYEEVKKVLDKCSWQTSAKKLIENL